MVKEIVQTPVAQANESIAQFLEKNFLKLQLRPSPVVVELVGEQANVSRTLATILDNPFLVGYESNYKESPFCKHFSSQKEYAKHVRSLYEQLGKQFCLFLDSDIAYFFSDVVMLPKVGKPLPKLVQERDVILVLDPCSLAQLTKFRYRCRSLYPDGLPLGVYVILTSTPSRNPRGVDRLGKELFGNHAQLIDQQDLPSRKPPFQIRKWSILARQPEKIRIEVT